MTTARKNAQNIQPHSLLNMSTACDGEKGPSGEDKGGGKGTGKAQVVGAEEQGRGNKNTSKHADTD